MPGVSSSVIILYKSQSASFIISLPHSIYQKIRSIATATPHIHYRSNCAVLPPGNPALFSYIPRSDCGLYYCSLLSTGTPSLSNLHFHVRFVEVCICHSFSKNRIITFFFISVISNNPLFPDSSFQGHIWGVFLLFLPVLNIHTNHITMVH